MEQGDAGLLTRRIDLRQVEVDVRSTLMARLVLTEALLVIEPQIEKSVFGVPGKLRLLYLGPDLFLGSRGIKDGETGNQTIPKMIAGPTPDFNGPLRLDAADRFVRHLSDLKWSGG